MLIADPSSTCDVCLEKFSSSRECWCIPCGHIFCRDCLSRLDQFVCPMCRTPLGSPGLAGRPLRKVHVDMAKCSSGSTVTDGPDARNVRRLRKLEQRLVTDTLDGHGLTVQRAAELGNEVNAFLRTQLPNEFALLRTIEILLRQLSATMAHVYEDTSLTKAIKASYDHRIQQLEKSLKEQTRLLGGTHESHVHDERNRHGAHAPRPQTTQAPRQEARKSRKI